METDFNKTINISQFVLQKHTTLCKEVVELRKVVEVLRFEKEEMES